MKKCALFRPSETAIKTMAKEMGGWLEEHEDEVLAEIRVEENLPEETRVLRASLDGVNVLLNDGTAGVPQTSSPLVKATRQGSCRDAEKTCPLIDAISLEVMERDGFAPSISSRSFCSLML